MSTAIGKKRERAAIAWRSLDGALSCPHCGSSISLTTAAAVCSAGHAFDLSRKGTLHLLASPHQTQYDRALFLSRERIIATGLYDRVLDTLADEISCSSEVPLRLVDAGCGEGSHLRRLKTRIPPKQEPICVGVDIAKAGIEIAGTGEPDVLFAVADLAKLPFADGSFGAIINFLSPANYNSFRRVLTNSGRLYKVVPGPDYLHEIRVARSETTEGHYRNDAVIEQFQGQMELAKQIHLNYTFPLEVARLEDLVRMTPLGWHDDGQVTERLKEAYGGSITIDLTILIGES